MRILQTPPGESKGMEAREGEKGEGEMQVLIEHCCALATRAHSSSSPDFLLDSLAHPSPCSIFAFPASWSPADWIYGGRPPFGDSEIDASLFPSLRRIGSGVLARVNAAFLSSFGSLLVGSSLPSEVHKAVGEKRRIIFTGHSTGGSIAVLATVWLLEGYAKLGSSDQVHPMCVTFGSPLIGDSIFNHALEREDWSRFFLHFVTELDIVPRIVLTPPSSFIEEFQAVLHFLCPKTSDFDRESIRKSHLVPMFYENLLRSALSISSYQACMSMGCTNSILGTLTSFIELSPYRPAGRYVFLTGKEQVVVLKNSEAILQLLFDCLKLTPQQQLLEVAYRSLNEHWQYDSKVKQCILRNVARMNHLEALCMSITASDAEGVGAMLGHLQPGREVRLCLRAAWQWEKQRQSNQARIDANSIKIQETWKFLNDYRATCEIRGLNYYDTFKLQRNVEDFNANVKRLELAGLWDEIIEMLRRNELPDGFEGRKEWVNLGTIYRCLVEPLDIANYYRHSKNEDTGSYMLKGRPRRYRYTQKWHEQAHRMDSGSSMESCFWAMVEELQIEMSSYKQFDEVRDTVVKLEREVLGWFNSGSLCKDVFLGNSTFVVWWKKALPEQHRSGSCIAKLVYGEENLSSA